MIVTRAPLRLPLGGGGTDLPAFYRQSGGFFVSAAIDRFVYVVVNRRFERSYRVSYSRTEICDTIEEIQHPIVREALRMLEIPPEIEVISVADVPANTGLGSSGAFSVALLLALHRYRGDEVDPAGLAEEAFQLEAIRLGEPVGKQDQYVAAFGGVRAYTLDQAGTVSVAPVALPARTRQQLEENLVLCYTGVRRAANEVLSDQQQRIATAGAPAQQAMQGIMAVGYRIRDALQAGDVHTFAGLMNDHWAQKRLTSDRIASADLDTIYELGRANGALGGKLIGAGGGGFFLFYCGDGERSRLTGVLDGAGFQCYPIRIEERGVTSVMPFDGIDGIEGIEGVEVRL